MALEKKVTYDYEIRGEFKTIQQRTRTAIEEDGVELSFSYHRNSFMIGTDVSGELADVRALSSSLWTQPVSASYSLFQTSQSLGL